MRRILYVLITSCGLVFLAYFGSSDLPSQLGEASCKNGIWAWRPSAIGDLREIDTPYIFQGLFWITNDREVYEFQGIKPFPVRESDCDLVLTYRLNDLVPVEMLTVRYQVHRKAWENKGNRVSGLQIDFDSPSAGLGKYAQWLNDLRSALSTDTSVSITGLPDWLISAPVNSLKLLAAQTDFIAFMMYRGTTPIRDPAVYYAVLRRSNLKFKVGLLATQDRDQHLAQVQKLPGYIGTSIFITK